MTHQSPPADLLLLIDESIRLELNMSELYFLFFEHFKEDAEFWWQLVEEENNHAALLRSGREYFEPMSKFPPRILDTNLDELKSVNTTLRALLTAYHHEMPLREVAFACAITLESSAGELHFQQFMENETAMSYVDQVFCRLNREDIAHAERITSYMQSHSIATIDHFTL